MAKKVNVHYVNGKELFECWIAYRNSAWTDRKIYNRLGEMLLKIARRKLDSSQWRGYTYDRKCEMESDAAFWMLRKIPMFDPSISENAFAYFSEVAENQYRLYMKNKNIQERMEQRINFLDALEDAGDNSEE